jgi:tight adherence protein C
MLYVAAGFVAISVALLVMFFVQIAPGRSSALSRGLAELEEAGRGAGDLLQRRRRLARTEQLKELLEGWGERVEKSRSDTPAVRAQLIQAGYMGPSAVAIYWGARLFLMGALGTAGVLLLPFVTDSVLAPMLGALWLAAFGYVAPAFYVGARVRRRQKEIIKALPDTLDMMVVCVEAGLALNQAILRVSQEIGHVSALMAEQLSLVNIEIRAGTAREEALKNLGERTGVADIRSFVTMLIQTDRFGTSIAQALRTHADVMRTKRRQRAEEAAAKTTIKLVFPLVFFVFPAMFVVILAPALIQIIRTLKGLS